MLQSVLIGAGFAFGAALQPGPLQAYLVSRAATIGWRRTLPACFAPLLSDGPIALLALLVLGQLSAFVQGVLRASGGVLLLALAWTALRRRRGPARTDAGGSAPRTLLEAALVNALNPSPYLGWALVLGPAVIGAWRKEPATAVVLLAAFYGTLIVTNGAIVFLVGAVRSFGPRVQRALGVASGLALAILGAVLFVMGLRDCGWI
jgi:threonine/homoserine/homoserine lactone efflux protein